MANFGKGRRPYPQWTAEEVATLRRLLPRASWPEILAALPGHTRLAIWQKGHNVEKIQREINKREKWTVEEIAILRRAYPSESDDELCRSLPRHSLIAIQRQASSLRILRPRHEARSHGRRVHPIIQRLYRLRLAKHMRRPELAKKLGYAHGQLLGWELGKTNPEFRIVAEWAQALGLQIILQDAPPKELPVVISLPDRKRLMAGR